MIIILEFIINYGRKRNNNIFFEEYNGSLTLDDTGGFTIESSLLKENISNSIKGNSEGIELVSTNGNSTTLITQEADSITLNSGGTAIGIKSDSINIKIYSSSLFRGSKC